MSDGADDGYVKIGAYIDPTGATEGANQTVAAVNKIGEATEREGERVNTSVLGNLRSVHHLVGGLIELGEGGTAAIGGLAAEGRVATEVFEGMLGPLAPILLIITTITQIAIPLFTHAIEEHKKKQEEANEALEKQNEKLDELKNKHAEDAIKVEADAVEDLAKEYKAANDELERRSKNAKQDASNDEARIKAVKDLTLALLEQQKQAELSKAKGQDERDAIEAKYKVQEAQVTGASQQQIDQIKKAALDPEVDFNNQQRAQTQGQINDLDARLAELKQQAAAAASKADDLGIEPDETGSFSDAYKEEKEKNKAATKDYNDALHEGAPEWKLDSLFDKVIESIPRVRAAYDADQAQQRAGGKEGQDLAKSIDELSKKMDDLVQTYTNLTSQSGTLEITTKADQAKSQTDIDEAKQDARTKALNDAAANRRAQRESDINGLQSQRDALEPNDPRIQALETQIAQLRAAGIRDEKATKIATGEIAEGSPQAKLYDSQAAEALAKAEQKTRDAESAAKKAEDTRAEQSLRAIQDAAIGHKDVGTKTQELAQLTALFAREQGKVNDATLEHVNRAIDTLKAELANLGATVHKMK